MHNLTHNSLDFIVKNNKRIYEVDQYVAWLAEEFGIVFVITPNPFPNQWACEFRKYPEYESNKQVGETWDNAGYTFKSFDAALDAGIDKACTFLENNFPDILKFV